MNLLLPCAGLSSRYSTRLPKYLLTLPDGRLMVQAAADSMYGLKPERVIAGVLAEHDKEFDAARVLRYALGCEVVVVSELQNGPAETVAYMLEKSSAQGSFAVRDCDSLWEFAEMPPDDREWMAVLENRREFCVYYPEHSSLEEKPYEMLSVGAYGFLSTHHYAASLSQNRMLRSMVSGGGELFLSRMFSSIPVLVTAKNYVSLGSEEEWLALRRKYKTYIVDVDGVIYQNTGEYISPTWGSGKVFEPVVARLRELHAAGNTIVLMTARPESLRKITEAQLFKDNVPFDVLVTGVIHGQRVLVNDYSSTNPYPMAVAVNVKRDSGEWPEGL